MSQDEPVEVRRVEDKHRYEVLVDGDVAGFSAFRQEGDAVAFTHTELDDAYKGRGLGSTLVGTALREVADQGGAVLPYCEFVRSYLGRHPELVSLVPAERRAEFALDGPA